MRCDGLSPASQVSLQACGTPLRLIPRRQLGDITLHCFHVAYSCS
jgi:hypothetical protein